MDHDLYGGLSFVGWYGNDRIIENGLFRFFNFDNYAAAIAF